MDNKKSRISGPFPVDYSDSESEQGDEEEGVGDRTTLEGAVAEIGGSSVGATLIETSVLPFSAGVVRELLSNLSQENARRLVEIICANYGYSTFTTDIYGCFSHDFFQGYASRNGYSLTPAFLALLNELRTIFSDTINRLLDLNNFNYFLYEIDRSNLSRQNVLVLMNMYSLDFSNYACSVRPELVNFLRSTIIPALIKIINQNTVVRGTNECELSPSDKEQLFLHVVTMYERSIMIGLMNYWNSFCSINQALLLLLPHADYSNPFIIARDNFGFILPDVLSPAAFTTIHGIFLSFMAVDRLDKIVEDRMLGIIGILQPIVLERVTRLCSDFVYINEMREPGNRSLSLMIYEEFSKIMDSGIRNEIIGFLGESLMWSPELLSNDELQLFVSGVVGTIYRSVEGNLINCCLDAIQHIADSIEVTKKQKAVSGEKSKKPLAYFRGEFSISGKCGFNVDENFCKELMAIRSRFLSSFRPIARGRFTGLVGSRNLSSFDWRDNSYELMSLAKDAAKNHTDAVVKEMKDLIPKARIVCVSGEKRKLDKEEQSILFINVMRFSNKRFRDNMRKVWEQVVRDFVSAGPSGVSSAAGPSGVSSAAGPSGVSSAAGPSGVSSAAGPSGVSSVSSSRDDSIQTSSSSVIVKGKSKGKKRKRDDDSGVAPSEDRPGGGIVRFEYGSILVREEFNNEINEMVSEHLSYIDEVFDDIRADLEEAGSYTTDNMRMQSREAISNIIPEFMARVRAVVSNASVYDGMRERGINEDEVSSVEAHIYGLITICHDEVLARNLDIRTVNNK
ncbi:collagen-like triple helix repeat-containing protein [Candidatus Ichthyocystis hellenicum]|uniref:collagen-like triple helix repeat-containing protein n=1 Tax=Candidatus Ichthyocystis hellenicum TaxID=1561003 RepID=UPI000B0B0357|nr:collagen-like protein [Candidatus Ichthyocystis hellenicum]